MTSLASLRARSSTWLACPLLISRHTIPIPHHLHSEGEIGQRRKESEKRQAASAEDGAGEDASGISRGRSRRRGGRHQRRTEPERMRAASAEDAGGIS
jgi:hypothetical protein